MIPEERSNIVRAVTVAALFVAVFYRRCPTCGSLVSRRQLLRRRR